MNYKQGQELLVQLDTNTAVLGKIVPQNREQIALVRDLIASNVALKAVMTDELTGILPDVYTITVQDCYHDTDRDNYPRSNINEVDEYEDDSADKLIARLVDMVVARNIGQELSEAHYKTQSPEGYYHMDYPFHCYGHMRCNGQACMSPDEVWGRVTKHPKYVDCLASQLSLGKRNAKAREDKCKADRLAEFKRIEAGLKKEGLLP